MKKSIPIGFTLSTIVAAVASGQSIYQLTSTTSTGLDLTAMSGYYADRMYGPSSGEIEFSGPLTYDSAVSASNPFQLIGRGGKIKVKKTASTNTTNLNRVPLKLYADDGVSTISQLYFYDLGYAGASLDIGRGYRMEYDYKNGNGEGWVSSDTIMVHDGGDLKSDYRLVVGGNMSVSVSVTSGASITAGQGLTLGLQNKSLSPVITAFMGITNGTVTAGGTDLSNGRAFTIMFNGGTWNADAAHVVIGEGGLLRANSISHSGAGNSRISFDGGSYKPASGESASLPLFNVRGYISWGSNHYPEPHMTVEGSNGHPIDVETALNRNLSGGTASGNRQINLTGDGGFTKRGAGTLTFNRLNDNSTCNYTGPTTILGGGIVVTNSVFKPGRGDLAVSDGSFLDLNSFDAEFAGATGAGIVTNGADSVSILTLGYGNTNAEFSVAIGERINVVKTGTGTLTVSGSALANTCDLTVEAGTVVFTGDSSSYGTVRVKSGATFDSRGTRFSCERIIKERGGTVLPPAATVVYVL